MTARQKLLYTMSLDCLRSRHALSDFCAISTAVRRFMQLDALDNAGGDGAVKATRGHMVAFLSGYRLAIYGTPTYQTNCAW